MIFGDDFSNVFYGCFTLYKMRRQVCSQLHKKGIDRFDTKSVPIREQEDTEYILIQYQASRAVTNHLIHHIQRFTQKCDEAD